MDWFLSVIQILLLFLAIYGTLRYVRNSIAGAILFALIMLFFGVKWFVDKCNLTVLSSILSWFSANLAIILVILFHSELKRSLSQFGGWLTSLYHKNKKKNETISNVVDAVFSMASKRCGAIIVIERKIKLQNYAEDSGAILNAAVSKILLESIFYNGNPLHDGAVIVRGQRILAAMVFLPLSKRTDLEYCFGTRHRAACGISEECDAVSIVVSEETGSVSLAYHGELYRGIAKADLEKYLISLVINNDDDDFIEQYRASSVSGDELNSGSSCNVEDFFIEKEKNPDSAK